MAKLTLEIDQLRDAGTDAGQVLPLVQSLEAQGLEIRLSAKDSATLAWLVKAQAARQGHSFRHWTSALLALTGLVAGMAVIVVDWLALS